MALTIWSAALWFFIGLTPARAMNGPRPAPDEPFNTYYAIHDSLTSARAAFQGPEEMLASWARAMNLAYDLLRFDFHDRPFPPGPERYNRKAHFGSWVDDPRDDTCYNTRAKVLIRDSRRPVSFKAGNRCVVEGGEWNEPYTGRQRTLASALQIDHMVPLKNAFISGAWSWDWPRRCLYANYIGNAFHLVSADGPENMRKGDRTPADWMPPNRPVACVYLSSWLKIKMIWGLVMHEREARAVQALVRQERCDPRMFQMSEAELLRQRQILRDNMNLCARLRPPPPSRDDDGSGED
ncbi:MAG: HNH endonuclease [Bdellovibrionaceae bacterium]|nr:HNH endonuclease [Pseudobdellovibrionaceae bacterium]